MAQLGKKNKRSINFFGGVWVLFVALWRFSSVFLFFRFSLLLLHFYLLSSISGPTANYLPLPLGTPLRPSSLIFRFQFQSNATGTGRLIMNLSQKVPVTGTLSYASAVAFRNDTRPNPKLSL